MTLLLFAAALTIFVVTIARDRNKLEKTIEAHFNNYKGHSSVMTRRATFADIRSRLTAKKVLDFERELPEIRRQITKKPLLPIQGIEAFERINKPGEIKMEPLDQAIKREQEEIKFNAQREVQKELASDANKKKFTVVPPPLTALPSTQSAVQKAVRRADIKTWVEGQP